MLDPGSKTDDGPWACVKPNLKRRLRTLRDGQCRWPLWDDAEPLSKQPRKDRARFYCSLPVVKGARRRWRRGICG
jgi:hypothetical protein